MWNVNSTISGLIFFFFIWKNIFRGTRCQLHCSCKRDNLKIVLACSSFQCPAETVAAKIKSSWKKEIMALCSEVWIYACLRHASGCSRRLTCALWNNNCTNKAFSPTEDGLFSPAHCQSWIFFPASVPENVWLCALVPQTPKFSKPLFRLSLVPNCLVASAASECVWCKITGGWKKLNMEAEQR